MPAEPISTPPSLETEGAPHPRSRRTKSTPAVHSPPSARQSLPAPALPAPPTSSSPAPSNKFATTSVQIKEGGILITRSGDNELGINRNRNKDGGCPVLGL